MATRVLRPVERMVLIFTDNLHLTTVTLARRINVAAFKEVTAYVRMHPGSLIGANPTNSLFIINADGYTDEDPGAVTTTNIPAFQTMLVQSNQAALAAGGMAVLPVGGPSGAPVTTNFGSLLSIQWTVQTSSVVAINLIVSVDLICKEF